MSDHPFKHVELEILTACDLACFACDRMSDVASKGVPHMSLEQVKLFVDESLELGWEWERIRLLGGEPTLHPRFVEMLDELFRYRRMFPDVFLQVLTNGLGKAKQYRELCRIEKVSLHAEQKQRGMTPRWFNNTRITPLDRGLRPTTPCGIFGVRGCGIGLTRHGYFLDGAGATVARVAGHDIGVMHLRDVTWERMLEQAAVLCMECGHWNPADSKVTELVTATGEVTGAFWTRKLAEYKEKRPVLRVFGEGNAQQTGSVAEG